MPSGLNGMIVPIETNPVRLEEIILFSSNAHLRNRSFQDVSCNRDRAGYFFSLPLKSITVFSQSGNPVARQVGKSAELS